jgi:hypothetical protein
MVEILIGGLENLAKVKGSAVEGKKSALLTPMALPSDKN